MGCAARKALAETDAFVERKKMKKHDSIMVTYASVFHIPVRDYNGKFLGHLERALSEFH